MKKENYILVVPFDFRQRFALRLQTLIVSYEHQL